MGLPEDPLPAPLEWERLAEDLLQVCSSLWRSAAASGAALIGLVSHHPLRGKIVAIDVFLFTEAKHFWSVSCFCKLLDYVQWWEGDFNSVL